MAIRNFRPSGKHVKLTNAIAIIKLLTDQHEHTPQPKDHAKHRNVSIDRHCENTHQSLIDHRHRRKHCSKRNVFRNITIAMEFAQIRNI